MNLSDVTTIAKIIKAKLAPYCERCEAAGSVRRLKPDNIKDIEIVIIPKSSSLHELCSIINNEWGPPSMGKWPSKYTKIRGIYQIDIFTFNRETWGLGCFIRTGPAGFCQRALAHWKKITSGGYSEDCQLRNAAGDIIGTPDELSVFKALGLDWIPPSKRT